MSPATIYKLFKALLFCTILILLDYAGGLLLHKQVRPYYYARSFNEFYSSKTNIDIVFLGSSHAYRSFDPFYFEDQTGKKTFNFGTSGQNPISTFYVLNEIVRKKFQPQIVVIEGYWPTIQGKDFDFTSTNYLYQVMEPSFVKVNLWKDGFSFSDKVKLISHAFTFRDYFKNIFWKPDLSKTGEYKGRGYVSTKKVVSLDELENSSIQHIKNIAFNQYRIHYFEKIIAFAKAHGFKTILVVAPIPRSIFLKIEPQYFAVSSLYNSISKKYDIEYIDYNLINKHKNFILDSNFSDDNHLNESGVIKMNQHFYNYHLKKYL